MRRIGLTIIGALVIAVIVSLLFISQNAFGEDSPTVKQPPKEQMYHLQAIDRTEERDNTTVSLMQAQFVQIQSELAALKKERDDTIAEAKKALALDDNWIWDNKQLAFVQKK